MIRLTLILALFAVGNCVLAAPRIAILDFELNDITSLPNTPAERIRTASIRPLLEQALVRLGDYRIIRIDADDQAAANSSVGYLYRFSDLAAELGKRHGADWVIVGQHSKPSFLFSYLMVHLIRVKDQKLATDYAIELKGNHQKVTRRGVRSLAKELHSFITK